MTLVIIKNREALEMTMLMRYALASIFDPDSLKPHQIRAMQESIVNWQSHFKYKKEIGLSAVDQELLESLQDICWLLQKNDEGELELRKALFKNHGIDYRKVYRLPGAHKPEDFHKAQLAYEETKKEHPEEYA